MASAARERAQVLLTEITKLKQDLDIVYNKENDDTVKKNYESSLRNLSECLRSLGALLDEDLQDDRREVLKTHIPGLVIQAAAHCGRHYWTSSATRKHAHGLLSSIISACGCESMLELLVGEQSTGYTHSSPYLPLDNSHVVSSNDSPGDNSQALLPTVDLESRLTAITNEGERVQNEEEKAATGIETTTANKSRLLTAVSKEHQGEEKNATGTTGDQDTTSVVEVRVGECNSTRLQPSVDPLDWPEVTTQSTDTSHQQQKLLETDRSVDTLAKNQHSLPVELCTTKVVFRSGLLKYILSELRTKLVKDTWKTHPAAKHALLLCLKHLKHPYVGPHLDSFLPPVLMLLDDYEVHHKVLGLSAVTHLIQNVDPTELRWYGRADVIYKAVMSMLYSDEVDVIHALHPCILRLLPVVEGPPVRTIHGPRKPSKTDEVFAIFLNNLDHESKIVLRKAYLAHLSGYVELLGIYVVRHMKQLLTVLFSCLEFPDYSGEETRRLALKSLATLMRYAWPRVRYHKDDILKTLLKLVSDLCPSNDEVPNKPEMTVQLPLISECLVLLARCCSDLQETYRDLREHCNHQGLMLCLTNTLEQLT